MARAALPSRLLRSEAVYRSSVKGAGAGQIDCGFILKPHANAGYVDRVVPRYVGIFVLRGSGVFTDWEGVAHPVEAGCYIHHPPGRKHSVVPASDGRWAEFFFQMPAAFWRVLSDLGSLPRQNRVLEPGLDAGLIDRFERLLSDARHAAEPDASLALARVHELLVTAYRLDAVRREHVDAHARALDEARAQLAANLDLDISLPAIASKMDLSYERFRKLFKQRFGAPPGEYRIRRRIDRARQMIAETRLSNKQVAYALGYPDPFTFSKQFKKYAGMSPATFRASL